MKKILDLTAVLKPTAYLMYSLYLAIFLSLLACSEEGYSPIQVSKVKTEAQEFQVYKDPNCQCCDQWVEHMESAGFSANTLNVGDISAIKSKYSIEPKFQSCHTAVIGNYVIEGHVPAPIIRKFLSENPKDSIGLAVPGMPVGSPGMEYNNRHQDYDVLLLNKDGSNKVYARINTPMNLK